MSTEAPPAQPERIPLGQVLLDDFFFLFVIGVAIPFVFYTVWGLIDIGSTPLAKPVVVSAPLVAPPPSLPTGTLIVDATMSEFRFTLSQTEFQVGKPVRFAVTNKGKLEHDLNIEEPGTMGGMDMGHTEGAEKGHVQLQPGGSGYVDYVFDDAGEYQIACRIPGHLQAGMVMKIKVQ